MCALWIVERLAAFCMLSILSFCCVQKTFRSLLNDFSAVLNSFSGLLISSRSASRFAESPLLFPRGPGREIGSHNSLKSQLSQISIISNLNSKKRHYPYSSSSPYILYNLLIINNIYNNIYKEEMWGYLKK